MMAQQPLELGHDHAIHLVIRGGRAKKRKSKAEKRFEAWNNYIRDESLKENWQRFLHDLGLGDFKSKTQCKKRLQGVWINIVDFLAAVRARDTAAQKIADEDARAIALATPVEVNFFVSQRALARYTVANGKVFPRRMVDKESPLELLLAQILHPR